MSSDYRRFASVYIFSKLLSRDESNKAVESLPQGTKTSVQRLKQLSLNSVSYLFVPLFKTIHR